MATLLPEGIRGQRRPRDVVNGYIEKYPTPTFFRLAINDDLTCRFGLGVSRQRSGGSGQGPFLHRLDLYTGDGSLLQDHEAFERYLEDQHTGDELHRWSAVTLNIAQKSGIKTSDHAQGMVLWAVDTAARNEVRGIDGTVSKLIDSGELKPTGLSGHTNTVPSDVVNDNWVTTETFEKFVTWMERDGLDTTNWLGLTTAGERARMREVLVLAPPVILEMNDGLGLASLAGYVIKDPVSSAVGCSKGYIGPYRLGPLALYLSGKLLSGTCGCCRKPSCCRLNGAVHITSTTSGLLQWEAVPDK